MKHEVLQKRIQTIWTDASPHWQAPEASKFYNNTIRTLENMVSANELATFQMKEKSDEIVEIAQGLYYDM